MLKLKCFTFNPFQENTYLIWDASGIAAIIDPGNSTNSENTELLQFIKDNRLNVQKLLLTHAHIDHVMGNKFIHDKFGLLPEVHKEDVYFIQTMAATASMYGLSCEASPSAETYLEDGQLIQLGDLNFQCIHTPGHSPGSISFYFQQQKIVISGDVLFNGSIGRTDLPMGNYDTLISSIKNKLLPLGDDIKVYSGHGPSTSIGFEKLNNPFLT